MREDMSIENLLEQYVCICLGALGIYRHSSLCAELFNTGSLRNAELNVVFYIRDGEKAARFYVSYDMCGLCISAWPEKMPNKILRVDRGELENVVTRPTKYTPHSSALGCWVSSV